jgi:hypothetical protein
MRSFVAFTLILASAIPATAQTVNCRALPTGGYVCDNGAVVRELPNGNLQSQDGTRAQQLPTGGFQITSPSQPIQTNPICIRDPNGRCY